MTSRFQTCCDVTGGRPGVFATRGIRPGGKMVTALLLALIGAVYLASCTNIEQAEVTLDGRDEATYGLWVEPYVSLRCGSLDCHGDKGRPLRLYGAGGLRSRPELRGEFTAPEEVRASVLAFTGVSPDIGTADDNARHLAMQKGLAVDAGGLAHVGGDIWASVDEPGYRCLHGWLEGRADDVDVQADCAFAAEQVPH